MQRSDSRKLSQLRPMKAIRSPQRDPAGSVLIEWGQTKVLCSVMVEDKVPSWMKEQGVSGGWMTAEYGMLPGSSDRRISRDRIRQTGRTHEIQRLIGRSLRASLDLKSLGSRTIQIDCDVLQADGGTRVASITGACLALHLALKNLKITTPVSLVAAVSVGKVGGDLILDLSYEEDVEAEVDANIVMKDPDQFIEIQGTAEKGSFSKSEWDRVMELAIEGCQSIFEFQRQTLKDWNLI